MISVSKGPRLIRVRIDEVLFGINHVLLVPHLFIWILLLRNSLGIPRFELAQSIMNEFLLSMSIQLGVFEVLSELLDKEVPEELLHCLGDQSGQRGVQSGPSTTAGAVRLPRGTPFQGP